MKTNKLKIFICLLLTVCGISSCGKDKLDKKGFQVANHESENTLNASAAALHPDSVVLELSPRSILLTGMPEYRLTTIYKVNTKKDGTRFLGSDSYHIRYDEEGYGAGNQWNFHYLPGFEALSGYNLLNVSHYDLRTEKQKSFFDHPVLIKTLYFPSYQQDTLNHKPLNRDFFMVTVYDEDTNKDGRLDMRDLRRMYHFDKDAQNPRLLIPANYSVLKSDYDPANDYFYIYAVLDENKNGQHDVGEPTHIFWIDLKDPRRVGRMF